MSANRILIDPEQKRLFVLDFRPGKRLYSNGDAKTEGELMEELCDLLRSLCKEVMNCYYEEPFHSYKFKLRKEYKGESYERLERELEADDGDLDGILGALDKLAIELKVAEHPFTLQDKPLLERVSWY